MLVDDVTEKRKLIDAENAFARVDRNTSALKLLED